VRSIVVRRAYSSLQTPVTIRHGRFSQVTPS
jgi:hypothetical protein